LSSPQDGQATVSMAGGYDGARRSPPRTAYDAFGPRASAAAQEV
jgi:hypothetical protein